MDLRDEVCAENVLTDPAEVTQFVERTGVDALAVSIGTSHGVYRSLPNLNIERLKELNAASRVPAGAARRLRARRSVRFRRRCGTESASLTCTPICGSPCSTA